jgi:NAD(P)-dependent dehydrogenase (short-subunit alcohol dehydrogenase family)
MQTIEDQGVFLRERYEHRSTWQNPLSFHGNVPEWAATSGEMTMSKLTETTESDTSSRPKTIIVTGVSQGIGAGVTRAFIERGYNVVANSLDFAGSAFTPTGKLALVDGDIGQPSTAEKIADTAIGNFGSQMLAQETGGSVTCVTSAMVEHPIAGVKASIPMITKGGLEAITRSLAMEYAKEGIRFNAVAPGVVDTPMHRKDSKEALKSLSPMGVIPDVSDIVDAIVYLTEARQITGEVVHVDAGRHNGKW